MEMDDTASQFLMRHLGRYDAVLPLAGYASTRQYFRVRRQHDSVILCRDPEFIESPEGEYAFLIMHKLLSDAAVPVPAVLAGERASGLLILEDLGDGLLDSVSPGMNDAEREKVYDRIMDALVRLQGIKGTSPVPFGLSFDREKLMFEFNFFIEHGLCGFFGQELTDADRKTLNSEFMAIAEKLQAPEQFVLNHRDFHSRNIIIRDGLPFFIDFQHARTGLPQYDLASLLYDDYVPRREESAERRYRYYYRQSLEAKLHRMDPEEFRLYFDLQAFQRVVKALGTFGYQVTVRRNAFYRAYAASTMQFLPAIAGRCDAVKGAFSIIGRIFEAVQ